MKGKRKILLISLLALTVLAATVTLVYAYYIHRSNDLVSEFSPAASVDPTVGGTIGAYSLDGGMNTAVSVGETNYPVYVRAAIVATWQKQDASGGYEVYFKKPVEDVDYTIAIGENWTKNSDGFYYYSSALPSNGATTDLIRELNVLGGGGDGYELSVEIVAQTIQAVGSNENGVSAVMDAWSQSR